MYFDIKSPVLVKINWDASQLLTTMGKRLITMNLLAFIYLFSFFEIF